VGLVDGVAPDKKLGLLDLQAHGCNGLRGDEIVAFAKLPTGAGNAEKRIAARPPQQDIDEAFASLLQDVQFEHTRVNAGYVQALGLTPVAPPAAR
jgi:hypothetical protein